MLPMGYYLLQFSTILQYASIYKWNGIFNKIVNLLTSYEYIV